MESAIVQHLNPEFEPVAVVWSNSIPNMRHLAVNRSWLKAANEWCKKTSTLSSLRPISPTHQQNAGGLKIYHNFNLSEE